MFLRDIIPKTGREKSGGKSVILKEPADEKQINAIRNLAMIFGAACLLMFIITSIHLANSGLRIKRNIVEAAGAGFDNIVNAALALKDTRFDNAKTLFKEAEKTFQNIQYETWFTAPKIPTLTLSDPVFESANSLISAGKYLATAGSTFTQASDNLSSIPQKIFAANDKNVPRMVAPAGTPIPSLTEQLKKQMPLVLASAEDLKNANAEMQKVPLSFIPAQLRDKFRFAKDALSALSDFLKTLQTDIPAILALLGDSEPHTFLVLLQNSAELRPTGGFIGNYMIIETNDGYITKTNIFDTYSADHQLNEVLEPPAEILPVNKQWFMRDSNYSAHFPLSAAKAAWFMEKEKGPGVDTVIAIDQTIIQDLLKLTGPVALPNLGQPLTSANFPTVISYIVESKISGRENPKAILKNFLPAFQKALFKYADPPAILPLLRGAIESKRLMAYSKDPQVQAFFEQHGAAGLMKKLEPKEDYLNIVHTSIGGNKSDDYVAETIGHDTYLNSDGSVSDEVKITRKHMWNNETAQKIRHTVSAFGFSSIDKSVWEILGRSRNIQMFRIYVPEGSTLETSSDATTVHFDEETGKTYFSAKMLIGVNETKTLSVRYRLPFKLNLDPVDKYSLTVQKQAGQKNITIRKRIFPESRVMNYKYFPDTGTFDADGVWMLETELAKDMAFSSVWGK